MAAGVQVGEVGTFGGRANGAPHAVAGGEKLVGDVRGDEAVAACY